MLSEAWQYLPIILAETQSPKDLGLQESIIKDFEVAMSFKPSLRINSFLSTFLLLKSFKRNFLIAWQFFSSSHGNSDLLFLFLALIQMLCCKSQKELSASGLVGHIMQLKVNTFPLQSQPMVF